MAEESQFSSSRPDNKRKFDDPSPLPQSYNNVPPPLDGIQLAKLKAQEIAAKLFSDAEAKRPKVDNSASSADDYMQKSLGQQVTSLAGMSQAASFTPYGYGTSKKMNIPNGRVGVIIGRSGDTIKQLQLQSGAKIQVTRDKDADPNSQTRPVELTGTPEQISRAEQLINDVLAEADAVGSGTLTARIVGGAQSGTEQFVMKIPNNKVGLVIGKGGEAIKNMQANSGARIQVIPLHLPPGDMSTERTLQIDGTNEQIEAAKKLVNEIVSGENRARNPQVGGYYQQSYRPPQPPASWGPPGGPPPPSQQPVYGYAQPGAYPGAPVQYTMPQPPYGGSYPPQPAASAAYSTGWDQSSTQATQQTTAQATTGYDYYNQQQQQQSTTTAADNTAYGYGQGSYGDASYSQQQTYAYSQPASGYEQSYGSSAPPPYGLTTAIPTQDGSGSGPTYAAPGGTAPAPPAVQPSPTQQGYASQSGYSAPPTYGQSPQTQKAPAAATQPVYGQPPTSQAGYPPPPAQLVYGQVPPPPPSAAAQPSYAQPYQKVPPPYGGGPPPSQAGYGQQQSYGDSYGSAGGYSQPPVYGNEGSAAPTAAGGVTKSSPQS